jgi:hypothetical protein
VPKPMRQPPRYRDYTRPRCRGCASSKRAQARPPLLLLLLLLPPLPCRQDAIQRREKARRRGQGCWRRGQGCWRRRARFPAGARATVKPAGDAAYRSGQESLVRVGKTIVSIGEPPDLTAHGRHDNEAGHPVGARDLARHRKVKP